MKEAEAWKIVAEVWRKLHADQRAAWGSEKAPPFLWAEIKKGFGKDHRFYRALQQCLLSTDPKLCRINGDSENINRLSVAGAPTGVGEARGVLLIDNPYNPPRKRLWVYFRLDSKTRREEKKRPLSELMTDDGLILLNFGRKKRCGRGSQVPADSAKP